MIFYLVKFDWSFVLACVRACMPERARVGWMVVCTFTGYLISSVRPKILVCISSEWNCISRNFRKRGQLCEVYRNFRKFVIGKLCSILLASWNLRNFRLNGSFFRKFNNFRIFWKLCPVSKFIGSNFAREILW